MYWCLTRKTEVQMRINTGDEMKGVRALSMHKHMTKRVQ
jgi:hypothetical protein